MSIVALHLDSESDLGIFVLECPNPTTIRVGFRHLCAEVPKSDYNSSRNATTAITLLIALHYFAIVGVLV